MARQSEQLEHEAEEARGELAISLEELRARMTPREIVDEVVEYARDTPVADFIRNLVRDVRESPLPLVVIFAGIAWAAIASAIAQRRVTVRERITTRTAAAGARPTQAVERQGWAKAPVERQNWEVAPVCEPVE
jgi:hypothetical protein